MVDFKNILPNALIRATAEPLAKLRSYKGFFSLILFYFGKFRFVIGFNSKYIDWFVLKEPV